MLQLMFSRFLVCKRDDALASVVANLQIYLEQTKEAKKLGAKIIVFPEVMIYLFICI